MAPPAVEDGLRVEPGVPDVEVCHRRELGHRLSVRARNPSDDRARRLGRELARPGRDLEARGQPLDVPFERAGHGLVEVVHVEDQRAIRCREASEVREVGVATRLHPQPRARHRRQVGSHDHCSPAVEGERRLEHPLVTKGHELGDARGLLTAQEGDRIRSIRAGRPLGMRGTGQLGARRAPERCPLGRVEVAHHLRAVGGSGRLIRAGHQTATGATTNGAPCAAIVDR